MGENDEPGAAEGTASAAELRRRRLAAELRRNLQRRKAQTRARRQGDAEESDGLPAAPPPKDPDRS